MKHKENKKKQSPLQLSELTNKQILHLFADESDNKTFQFRGIPLFFCTDGIFIYASVSLDEDGDLEDDLFYHHEFYNELLSACGAVMLGNLLLALKKIEGLLGRELYMGESVLDADISIRSLELEWEKGKVMKIDVRAVKIAYVTGRIPKSIIDEMTELDATMYDDNGGGQYSLTTLRNRFDEDSEEYRELDGLLDNGYNYLEYS